MAVAPRRDRKLVVRSQNVSGQLEFDLDRIVAGGGHPWGDYVVGDGLDKAGLLIANGEFGRCRVECFTPRHDLTIARMSVAELEPVIDVWADEYRELGSHPRINSVQVFENRGAIMGCSNPHAHGQIWANETVPNELEKELRSSRSHYQTHGSTLLTDYLHLEMKEKERLV